MLEEKNEEDPSQITYYLSLDNSGRPKLAEDQILQAERDSILYIELMNGLEITNDIILISNAQENFPYELQEKLLKNENIKKDDFSKFIFEPTEISTSIIYQIKLERTGSIQFFFIYNKNTKNTKPFYITVLPKVIIGGKKIELDNIQLQTVLSKSLGKIDEFEKYFKEASRLKYNFVHFTPIQQLGISESLYCLRDNTKINNIFFNSDNLPEEQKSKLMKEQLDKGRDIYGIGSFVDIVLNHASDNSEWLRDNPECGYNLENTPWLNCAYEFDKVLQNYSNNFCDCKTARRFQPFVNNENELNEIERDLWDLINKANLYEFFMININENKKILENYYIRYHKDKSALISDINNLGIRSDNDAINYVFDKCLKEIGYKRNGVIIDEIKFGNCLTKLFNNNISNKSSFFSKAEDIMKACNSRWQNIIPEWLKGAMNNIKGGIRWEFITNHNKAIRVKKPLISPYFAVFDPSQKSKIFACNGWISESEDPQNPAPDFTKEYTYYYFKRKVNIWSDCPKLNYGNSPLDCPYLINHMTKYVQDMAKMFNGFRLDNAHSTPIFVAEYLAQKAREINPDLIIMAELFTKKENEINFVNRIGINLLIRELIWCEDAWKLSAQLHRFGGGFDHMLGKIEENKFDYVKDKDNVSLKKMKYLLPSLPHSIIFDLTHDNETYLQKMNNLSLNLTNMACNSFSSTAIGSTRGFDQLFPIQPSVVNEQRKYVYDEQFINLFSGEEHRRVPPKKEVKEKEPDEIMTKFEFKCNWANNVSLALSSRGWKPDINLNKINNDTFSTELKLKNNQKILYKYVVNGNNWICDDSKPKENDGKGNINNVIILGKNKINVQSQNQGQKEYHMKDLKILRRGLNSIRNEFSIYKNEFYLHQENQFLCIFRTFVPEENYLKDTPNCDGYALICRTGYDRGNTTPTRIELPGIYSEFVFGCTMGIGNIDINGFKNRSELYGTDSSVYFTQNGNWINNFSYINQERGRSIINFNANMPNNVCIVLKFKLTDEVRYSLINIEKEINSLNKEWKNLMANLDICDINLILYKCEKEELDNTKGQRGNYAFDKFGPLCYAGISHLHKKLNEFKLTKENNTILDNIRAGDWLLDYTIKRYQDQPNLKKLYEILCQIKDNYTKLYVHHKPVYITKIIDTLYNITIMKFYELIKNKYLINFSSFSRLLINAIPQFNGYIESSRFKYNTSLPMNKLSLSAGLPHFSTEYMRCWGRDTFIAFKGLFLIPGLFSEAKTILLNFASVMRHGLIPNLLDSGINSRYNARDATWFFMKSVVDYVEMSQDEKIFEFEINMVFLSDDYNDHNYKKNKGDKKIMKLCDIVHEILQRHINGINFREWRAGKQIDEQMTDEGFNIKIYFNEDNGFIYGGNKFNCGTWMDKMGSSEKAGNKGHPATPRNGADIEIIGLLYYTLVHLSNLNKERKYPYNEVKLNNGKKLKYEQWADKIKSNFEKYFFIEKKNAHSPHNNTYKDYISDDNDLRHEAQLRPNVFIPMAIAPELFNKEHAIKFMKIAEEFLVVKNCIGIRTLDYTDKNYNGDYYPDNDSNDYHLAHGLNYHNGPEWVWPAGFYLMSKINFNDLKENIFDDICQRLIPYEKYIKNDAWSGLPELTNKDGKFCPGSCNTQAWSISTIIEAVDLLEKKKEENKKGFDDIVVNKKISKKKSKNLKRKESDKKERKEKNKNKDIEKYIDIKDNKDLRKEEENKDVNENLINKLNDEGEKEIKQEDNDNKEIEIQKEKNEVKQVEQDKNNLEEDTIEINVEENNKLEVEKEKEPIKEEKIEIKKEEPEIKKEEEQEIEIQKDEPEIEIKKEEPEIEIKKEEPEIEIKKEEPEIEIKKEEPEIEIKKEEPENKIVEEKVESQKEEITENKIEEEQQIEIKVEEQNIEKESPKKEILETYGIPNNEVKEEHNEKDEAKEEDAEEPKDDIKSSKKKKKKKKKKHENQEEEPKEEENKEEEVKEEENEEHETTKKKKKKKKKKKTEENEEENDKNPEEENKEKIETVNDMITSEEVLVTPKKKKRKSRRHKEDSNEKEEKEEENNLTEDKKEESEKKEEHLITMEEQIKDENAEPSSSTSGKKKLKKKKSKKIKEN